MTSVQIEAGFQRLRSAARRDGVRDLAARRRQLDLLLTALLSHRNRIAAAISADFGHRSPNETDVLELVPCLAAVRHARRNLRRWMAPERRSPSIWFKTATASVRHQPLGVVGIIVPWNYPLFLAVSPLVGAIAAGNRVMLKLSELAPRTADAITQMLHDSFSADDVCVVAGPADTGIAVSRLPFDHLLFTGSTAVGRRVLQAAAANLTPVTLELGGKSPAIVGETYSLGHAAQRIVFGKALNAGQTCIAPDYVLVQRDRLEAFITAAKASALDLYPDVMTTPDYSTIINNAHFARLTGWLEEARAAGARIVPLVDGTTPDAKTRRIPPTAVIGAPDHCAIMREEIFGPLMPVVPYAALDDAIAYVNARPRPLALYLFDNDRHVAERVLHETVAGGVTINDVLMHIAQEDLPFGGVGASGMGRYHGGDGFATFSHAKAVFRQSRLNPGPLLTPPYAWVFACVSRLIVR